MASTLGAPLEDDIVVAPIIARSRSLPPIVALTAACSLLAIIALTVFGPIFAAAPDAIHVGSRLQGPSSTYWLGTDELGRDLLSRLLYGGRVSLIVGFASTALAAIVGVPAGLLAGYRKGVFASLVLRVTDVLLAFPSVLLAMLTATFFGAGVLNLSLAIAVVNVAVFVRLARAGTLSQKGLEYVDAARSLGCSDLYIIFRSILPNTVSPLTTQAALSTANAIVLEAGLSFLGLGVHPPTSSWGVMLQVAKSYLYQDPWYGLAPGLLLVAVVLSLNASADAFPLIFDWRLRA